MLPKLYEELFKLPGVSGHEEKVREYYLNFLRKYDDFEIVTDTLGSIFGFKKSKNPNAKTVMVGGHMDEVGFIVTNIRPNGAILILPLGGILGEVVVSQMLEIQTPNGAIPGIVGAKPPHLRQSQSTNIDDLYLDIGASSDEEAMSWGVSLGQPVTFANTFTHTYNKKRVISKAVDNRMGVGVTLELIKHFSGKELPFHLAIGATVQEEVGMRGAGTISHLIKPDMFIAMDSSPINDVLEPQNLGKMGEGAMIRIYDPGIILPLKVKDYFVDVAKRYKVKHQFYISKGNTDASKVLTTNAGVLSTAIVLPTRYIHSNAAMFEIEDLKAVKKMLISILEDLDEEKLNHLLTK
jgi:glutamyl aminopeptidase